MRILSHAKPVVITALLLLLAGCSGGSYTISVGQLQGTDHGISGSYNGFNGSYYKTTQFRAGDIADIEFFTSTQSGELTAKFCGPDGSITTINSNTDTSVAITKTGTYKILVNGNKHVGSFALDWRKRQ